MDPYSSNMEEPSSESDEIVVSKPEMMRVRRRTDTGTIIDFVTQEVEKLKEQNGSMAAFSEKIETLIDQVTEEAQTIARERFDSAESTPQKNLSIMSDLEVELGNLIFTMKVLLQHVRQSSHQSHPTDNQEYIGCPSPPCFFLDETESDDRNGSEQTTDSKITDNSKNLDIRQTLKMMRGVSDRIETLVQQSPSSSTWDSSSHFLLDNDQFRRSRSLSVAGSEKDFMKTFQQRLPFTMDDTVARKVQAMINDKATHSRSEVRRQGIEIHLKNFGYSVMCPDDPSYKQEVKTVYNQSFPYKLVRFLNRMYYSIKRSDNFRQLPELTERFILKDINIVLKPGKNYLVLGPPGSGKTTLLKAIASLLDAQLYVTTPTTETSTQRTSRFSSLLKAIFQNKNEQSRIKRRKGDTIIHGSLLYDGLPYHNDQGIIFRNSILYVDQMDRHAPRLTVQETFDFAFQCKTGGRHLNSISSHRSLEAGLTSSMTQKVQKLFFQMDKDNTFINILLEGLGLEHVKETFVGDSISVRGVSGGQRRRVSIGEMLSSSISSSSAIFCGDEISTGLDASSSYDIVYRMCRIGSALKKTTILSLLQPSPETLNCFDEIILLSCGKVIYAGPVNEAETWFHSLGYRRPPFIDVADFLLLVASNDDSGNSLYNSADGSVELRDRTGSTDNDSRNRSPSPSRRSYKNGVYCNNPYDATTLASIFQQHTESNPNHYDISFLRMAFKHPDEETGLNHHTSFCRDDLFRVRYHNSFLRFVWLNTVRSFTIWRRDTRFVVVDIVKNVVMGLSVGLVFLQTRSTDSIFGVLFQGTLFIMLASMTAAPEQLLDKLIFYKHRDANFYPTFSYVIGRLLAFIPQAIMDCFLFGTLLYWMVGLRASAEAFLTFIAILIVFTLATTQMLSIFSSIASSKSDVLAMSSLVLILFMLFCGFIVSPNVIPDYFIWLYWWNPLAWAYRALLVNEFGSDDYGDIVPGSGNKTSGDLILLSYGFELTDRAVFGRQWIAYAFIYLALYTIFCLILTGLGLYYFRPREKNKTVGDDFESGFLEESLHDGNENQLTCSKIDLTFKDICYDVRSSKGSETLRLLNGVQGSFRAGRMCALMGASGAGKTTLMDVIALRKTTGVVSGEIRLNGILQNKDTFPRFSGYVEQFDVQSAELTVLETVLFSAQLRLDRNHDAARSPESMNIFVTRILALLELTVHAQSLVGNLEEGEGLTFEQRKRLSIAVELAASPSIIFLDEPTSGLDSRAAVVVVKALQKIAHTGRTICCTIHQPSSVVFDMFDDLLLLKKGEVVFFGELGRNSANLIQYFESRGAPSMDAGENPSTWMLNTIAGSSDTTETDYVRLYRLSDEYLRLSNELSETMSSTHEVSSTSPFTSKYACSIGQRNIFMARRLGLIYWRSPSYNYARMLLCMLMGLLLSSVFIKNTRPSFFTETEIRSLISTIFISFIIVGVLSITTVMPVMVKIRDVFYRHRAAGMLNHNSLFWALAYAEMKFIVAASFLFCICFYFGAGFRIGPLQFASFWSFFTFNLAIYSYFGQAFTCSVRGMGTAQILAAIFIGLNNLFSGLIVRPQYLAGFWQAPYWITPGHYVFEGLVVTQFHKDDRFVVASSGSSFHQYLIEKHICISAEDALSGSCGNTVSKYVEFFFGGKFQRDHIYYDALILGLYLVLARLCTYIALRSFNYMAT